MELDGILNLFPGKLAVMGNLIDNNTPGAAGKVMWMADKGLGLVDPLLRRTRAST